MTPERKQRFIDVLNKRQSGLTVVLENVHDPHNISAVMRSCDAVGIAELYVLNTTAPSLNRWGKRSSASAKKWLKVHYFEDLEACMEVVKARYEHIWATHLSAEASSMHELDFTQSVALVFGNEKDGVSEAMLTHATGNFIIPMKGMIQSLNISVACAVTLYEALRQRELAGTYEEQSLPNDEYKAIHQDWLSKEKGYNIWWKEDLEKPESD